MQIITSISIRRAPVDQEVKDYEKQGTSGTREKETEKNRNKLGSTPGDADANMLIIMMGALSMPLHKLNGCFCALRFPVHHADSIRWFMSRKYAPINKQ